MVGVAEVFCSSLHSAVVAAFDCDTCFLGGIPQNPDKMLH